MADALRTPEPWQVWIHYDERGRWAVQYTNRHTRVYRTAPHLRLHGVELRGRTFADGPQPRAVLSGWRSQIRIRVAFGHTIYLTRIKTPL